jgi:hypothetical protein
MLGTSASFAKQRPVDRAEFVLGGPARRWAGSVRGMLRPHRHAALPVIAASGWDVLFDLEAEIAHLMHSHAGPGEFRGGRSARAAARI